MRAFRRRFVLVAAAVALPIALLVWRALLSVQVERQHRHEVVAERLFDEMERTLSDLLVREEARPVEGFTIEAAPDQPYVVGWFELEPDGRLRAPHALAPVQGALEQSWRGGSAGAAAQRPGSTLELADGKAQNARETARDDEVQRKEDKPKKDEVSAYDALRSLNKAVEQRQARQKKLGDEYAVEEQSEATRGQMPPSTREGAMTSGSRAQTGADLPADVRANMLEKRRRADVAPLVGRLLDPQHLALSRTVIRADGRGLRQGLVLELPALGRWVREQALDSTELGDFARVEFGTTDAPPPAGDTADFVYQHRFAEPFDALLARLTLRSLPGVGGAIWVYALSGLLVIAVGLGLLALYRMVAVALGFAERRSNFVAAVSHELKTPLTAIRMYGEMLRDGIVASEAKRGEYYRHITAESERLSRLINNVLEFSRLEKGTRAMSMVVGPIGPVLDEAATLLRAHVEQAGLVLRVEAEPGLPPVRFDRDALLQILFNLIDNAVKYAGAAASPASGGEIVLRATRADDRVALTVRDRGPGVPREHLGRIFEPFYRGENELVRRSKGTGLGLALVHGLGLGMGARVLGRNAPDGGFEVEVALPAAGAVAA